MRSVVAAACLLLVTSGTAEAGAIKVHGPSIAPDPDGALIFSRAARLDLSQNNALEVSLGYTVVVGTQRYSSIFIGENGYISFGAPAATAIGAAPAFLPVASLAELGVPIIAPFYADLAEQPERGFPSIGSTYLEYGYRADDPSTIAGERLTWYGLPVAGGNPGAESKGDGPAYAQLVLDDVGGGNFDFEFRADSPGDGPPMQDGRGSLQGFVLGGTTYQHDGPYTGDTPADFSVRGGSVAPVPEPRTWLTMLLGFAAVGAGLRRRIRRASTSAKVPQLV